MNLAVASGHRTGYKGVLDEGFRETGAGNVPNTVVYTGTHDNAPTREWYEQLPDYQRQNFWNCLKRTPAASEDAAPLPVDLAGNSTAALAVAPVQDLLNLGAQSRMNIPGRASGNWGWRFQGDLTSLQDFQWLRDLTETSKRVQPQTIDPEKIVEPKKLEPSGVPTVTVSEAV